MATVAQYHMWVHWTLLLLLLWATARTTSSPPDSLVSAVPGTDVVLPCSAPPGTDLEDVVLEWTRSDHTDYMFLFRDGRPYLIYQHPLFKNRVELNDPTFKNGNLSIVLRGAKPQDSGRYECHVVGHSHVRKRSLYDTEPITIIDLKVQDPESERIRVFPGQDVVLQMAPVDFNVTSWMLKRGDDTEHYVFLHGMDDPHHQNPQYKDRVQLKSNNQTQGLSVILKKVQPEDNGTYHFHIVQSQRRMKRDVSQRNIVKEIVLEVTSGSFRLEAGVGFVAAVFFSLFFT